mgnify:CR=1 FL=1
MSEKKTYVFDIDGTICSLTNGNYGFAVPYMDRIKKDTEMILLSDNLTK